AQESQLDYVCHEIEAALARRIAIVPVLVGGATAAELAGLPSRISGLAEYEAAELRDSTFHEDCTRLTKSLGLESVIAAGEAAGQMRSRSMRLVLGGVLFALLLVGSGWLGIGPWSQYRARKAVVGQMFATAKIQTERGDYDAAFRTY